MSVIKRLENIRKEISAEVSVLANRIIDATRDDEDVKNIQKITQMKQKGESLKNIRSECGLDQAKFNRLNKLAEQI